MIIINGVNIKTILEKVLKIIILIKLISVLTAKELEWVFMTIVHIKNQKWMKL